MSGRGREITAVKVATFPLTVPTSFPAISICFFHLKKHLASQKFHRNEEENNSVTT